MERDREVLADRLADRLSELDPALVDGRLRARLDDLSRSSASPSPDGMNPHAAVLAELRGPRYFALLDAFEALLAAPPYRRGAAAPAPKAAAEVVKRDHRRLREAVRHALALPPGPDRDVALHEARKAAKRARYSAEAAEPVLGSSADDHRSRMKSVQQLLGEHQDSVMCRVALARLQEEAAAAEEDPAPYDAMTRTEQRIAAEVEDRLPDVWNRADRSLG